MCQEGARAQLTHLGSITHPCIVGRKVASFCAFLRASVILQLNSSEFIQPSWILSVYFYVCGETKARRERQEKKTATYWSCRTYSGIYTEAWNSPYKYFRTLISAEINLGNIPRETRAACSQPLPHSAPRAAGEQRSCSAARGSIPRASGSAMPFTDVWAPCMWLWHHCCLN